jgi:hypothetical protein
MLRDGMSVYFPLRRHTYLVRSQRIDLDDVMAPLQAPASTWRVEGSSWVGTRSGSDSGVGIIGIVSEPLRVPTYWLCSQQWAWVRFIFKIIK